MGILLTVLRERYTTMANLKSMGIKKLLKIVKKALLKRIKQNYQQERFPIREEPEKVAAEVQEVKAKEKPRVPVVSEEYMLSENCIPSYSDMITSTPLKLKYMKKIIILHDVSDLKIYEDVEEVRKVDISAVTFYKDLEETNISQDRIYENIDICHKK